MSSDTPYEPAQGGGGKPLPERPANKTNIQDYQKSNDKPEQKDNNNGKW